MLKKKEVKGRLYSVYSYTVRLSAALRNVYSYAVKLSARPLLNLKAVVKVAA